MLFLPVMYFFVFEVSLDENGLYHISVYLAIRKLILGRIKLNKNQVKVAGNYMLPFSSIFKPYLYIYILVTSY